jgi:hypothetical protein
MASWKLESDPLYKYYRNPRFIKMMSDTTIEKNVIKILRRLRKNHRKRVLVLDGEDSFLYTMYDLFDDVRLQRGSEYNPIGTKVIFGWGLDSD